MITVHCGLHKTGSTSVQAALRKVLNPSRVSLPIPGQPMSDARLQERLRRLPDNGILSDEHVLGNAYDGYLDLPRRVDLINESLVGRDFQIVVYVRPQSTWLESLCIHHIQMGYRDDPRDVVSRVIHSPWVRWTALDGYLRENCAASYVHVQSIVPDFDVVQDFFGRVIGERLSRRARRIGRVNKSLDPGKAQLLYMALIVGIIDQADVVTFRTMLSSLAQTRAHDDVSILPEDVQSHISHLFREDWHQIARGNSSWIRLKSAPRTPEEDGFSLKPHLRPNLQSEAMREELKEALLGFARLASPNVKQPTNKRTFRSAMRRLFPRDQ